LFLGTAGHELILTHTALFDAVFNDISVGFLDVGCEKINAMSGRGVEI
jgi:hypothetical protein